MHFSGAACWLPDTPEIRRRSQASKKKMSSIRNPYSGMEVGGHGHGEGEGYVLRVFQGPACCVWVAATPPKLSARLNSLRRGKDFFLFRCRRKSSLAFQTKSGKLGNLIHICRQRIPRARLIKLKYAFLFGRYFAAPTGRIRNAITSISNQLQKGEEDAQSGGQIHFPKQTYLEKIRYENLMDINCHLPTYSIIISEKNFQFPLEFKYKNMTD